MNDPIIIPRTHLILDAAILTAISAGPTPGSPFEASFGIRETMLPGWLIKTRRWNNADVETAEESDESLLYFPGITPKLALFTVRNLIDQLGGHLTGEDWHPGDKKPFDLFDVLSRSETDIFPDEFCEFCGGDIAGREEEAAKAIEDVLSSVYFRSTLTYDRLTGGGHSTCYMQTVFSSYSASDTGDAFGVSLNEDITDSLIMRYQYGQTMTIPAGFLSIPSTEPEVILLALLLLEEGDGADRNICLLDIQRFMKQYVLWGNREVTDRSLIDSQFGTLTEAGFLDDWSYDDNGSDYWKRAVISYHLNI